MSIEETNLISYVCSSWITKYLWKAYRKGITLSEIPSISTLDSCSYNIRKFENLWNEELRIRGPSSASLSLVAWRFIRVRVIIACILNALSQITNFFMQTLLLQKLLEYCDSTERHFSSGMHWVIYMVAFDILQMTLSTWSNIMNQRTALRLKSVCLSLLFKKVINSNNFLHTNTNKISNILMKNGHKIYDAVNLGTLVVNAPVINLCALICISMWLSPLALTGLVILYVFYLSQYWLIHLINYFKDTAGQFTHIRIQKTIEVLDSIRLIKINGWEQHFLQNINNIRSRESKYLWKLSYVKSLNSSLSHAVPIIAIIVMFFMHFTMIHELKAYVVFPISIVIIVQMHGAFVGTKAALIHIKESLKSFNKIKKGLLLEDNISHIIKPYEATHSVSIVNGTFEYDFNTDNMNDAENLNNIIENITNNGNTSTEPEKEKLKTDTFKSKKRVKVLSDIIFKAKKGQLIGICGKPGSGKSSLILAALGQIKITNGQLMRQGSCAYVAQKAWIANATIRENILFEEPFDEKRYYEAQIISKLRQDIKRFPEGDETEIGEGGIDIPEDLKQKIALARAFYANRDIYFLDDPLVTMEFDVSFEIFENLIINALSEKTIILVTDEPEFLDRCDYTYIMRDGKILEHGTHKVLMRLGKEYAKMVKSSFLVAEGDYVNDPRFLNQPDTTVDETDKFNINETENIYPTLKKNLENEYPEANEIIDDEDNVGPEKIMGKTYYLYARSLGGFFLLLSVILAYAVYAGSEVLSLLRLTYWIEAINVDMMLDSDKEISFQFYKNWFGVCFFLVVLGCIIQSFVSQSAVIEIADNLHNALLNKLMYAPIKFFDAASFKKIRNCLLHDLNNVSLLLPSKLDNTLRYTMLGFFTFFVLMSSIQWFTNYIVLTSLIFFFIGKIYRTAQINFHRLENIVKLTTSSFLHNSIEGLSTIRTFKKENDLLRKFQKLVDDNGNCSFIKGISEKWLSIRLQLLTTTCFFVAATFSVTIKDEIPSALAGLTFLYILQIPHIVLTWIYYFMKTETCFVSVQNIYKYLHRLRHESSEKPGTIKADSKWPMTGLIEFDNVQLRHSDNEQLGLDHVSLIFKNAEKIGILAKTKIEKHLLIAAMYRLYELQGGTIFVDCLDISKIDLKQLRNRLSLIPHDPIFCGTLRFFLDPTKNHSDAEIWNALEKVHLKDKISGAATQLYYVISEKTLSICEKQLLFLARSLLRENRIILLEESGVISPRASRLIRKVIETEFSGSTVVIIAHHLNTVLSCDRVLVMDTGKVLEFDSPSTLLADKASNLSKIFAEEEVEAAEASKRNFSMPDQFLL